MTGCSSTSEGNNGGIEIDKSPLLSPILLDEAKASLANYLVSDNKILSQYVDFPFVGKNNIVVLEKERDFYGKSALFTQTYNIDTVGVVYLYHTRPQSMTLVPIDHHITQFPALTRALSQRLSSLQALKAHKNGYYVIELSSNVGNVRSRILLQDKHTHKIIGEF